MTPLASAPENAVVSAQVTDPPPLGVGEVPVVAELNPRFPVVPVTVGRPFKAKDKGPGWAVQGAPVSKVSAMVPAVSAVPVTV